MRRITLAALLVAVTCGLASAQGDADRIGPREEFKDVKDWRANNRKAPGKVEGDGEQLILTDLPGGQVQWGTSCAGRMRKVDLDKYPYLVIKATPVKGGFGCKLSARKLGRRAVLRRFGKGGLCVEKVGGGKWTGVRDLNVGLYVHGDGGKVKVDYVRFVSRLSPEEKAALNKVGGPVKRLEVPPKMGLKEKAARRGLPPSPGRLPYPSERFIYMDPLHHAWVWRMTEHPSIERHVYYDIPAWNANGSTMLFLSRRAPAGKWLMDADGSNIRPLPYQRTGSAYSTTWSWRDPDVIYYGGSTEKSTTVYALNVKTGKSGKVVSIPVGGLRTEPQHNDDRHFLLGNLDRRRLWVVDSKTGKWTDFPTFPTHRRRFTRAPDCSVFINHDFDKSNPKVRKRTAWVCRRDGSGMREITGRSGHPDWAHDGRTHSYYASGGVWVVNHDGTGRKQITRTGGGHGGWSMDSQWVVSDATRGAGAFANQVFVVRKDGGRIHGICQHNSSYSGWGSGVADPEATHPAPVASPDDTKIAYDSDMMGNPDLWVAVWKFPQRPRDVTLKRQGRRATLTWRAPERCKELADYVVYRKRAGEGEFRPVAVGVKGTRHVDNPGAGRFDYAVSAREASGLQSPLAAAWDGGRTVLVEPEDGVVSDEKAIVLDQRCGGGSYVSAPAARKAVQVKLTPASAKPGMAVWTRARDAVAGKPWTWRRAAAPWDGRPWDMLLPPGSEVDQVVFTSDASLKPEGVFCRPNAPPATPSGLTVRKVTPTRVELRWKAVPGAHHYNVYASRKGDPKPGLANLVGTPARPSFADWGLDPNARVAYRVAAADIWGNESAPSSPVHAKTTSKKWTYVILQAEDAALTRPMRAETAKGCAGRGYAHVPDSYSNAKYVEVGHVTFTFTVPETEEYVVYGRAMGIDGKGNSFFVRLDGGRWSEWHVPTGRGGKKGRWTWMPLPGCAPAKLTAGRHTLTVRSREDGTRLDQILITNDPAIEFDGPNVKRR